MFGVPLAALKKREDDAAVRFGFQLRLIGQMRGR